MEGWCFSKSTLLEYMCVCTVHASIYMCTYFFPDMHEHDKGNVEYQVSSLYVFHFIFLRLDISKLGDT